MKRLSIFGLWLSVYVVLPMILGGLVIKLIPSSVSPEFVSDKIFEVGMVTIGVIANIFLSGTVTMYIWEKMFAKKTKETS